MQNVHHHSCITGGAEVRIRIHTTVCIKVEPSHHPTPTATPFLLLHGINQKYNEKLFDKSTKTKVKSGGIGTYWEYSTFSAHNSYIL